MLRRILIIAAVAVIAVFWLSGCKERSSEAESGQDVPMTMAEYEAEAREESDKENMAAELESIEETLEQEIGQEQ